MAKYKIIEDAKRQVRKCFVGIAVPQFVPVTDDRMIDGVDYVHSVSDHSRGVIVDKLHKFNRKSLVRMGKSIKSKADPRYNGGEDIMIVKVGKPGSAERKEALAEQYAAILASGEEVSPFGWEG